MRNTITHKTLLGLAMPATAALLLAATPCLAQVNSKTSTLTTTTDNSPGTMTVVSSESLDQDGDNVKSETFEIRIEDGKVSVRQNGKDVPDARIERKDGRIVILDDNGNEVKEIKIGAFGAPGGYFYRLGAAEAGQHPSLLYPRLLAAAGALHGSGEIGQAGEDPKVMIGVHMGEPGAALEKHLHLDSGKTTMITAVFEGLPAEQAGVGEFDIIVGVDGGDAADADAVREALQSREPGDTVTLRVIQAGKQKDIKIKLQAYDAEKMHAAKLLGQAPDSMLGTGDQTLLNRYFGDLKDWNVELPQGMEGQLWVTPNGQKWQGVVPQLDQLHVEGLQKWEELKPMIQQQLHDALKDYHTMQGAAPDGGGSNGDVEKQLDRLDERLSHLEKLLQKLIEKQAKP